ncbi:hypothetical protein GGQ84_002981 [Desulfitispora alkaliphila]|uniref:quinate 5-dehydrogenase n=1 Tax=Desulfitispora alkaliphila TaxID=622674 RepID=UPI003D244589
MKKIVSVSLGSSKRNHKVELELLGEKLSVERVGTDGNVDKAIALIKELDGKVDAFGMGGIDLYIYAGEKRYTLREAVKIAKAAKKTPIVDGSGLKNTLERKTIDYLQKEGIVDFKKCKVLMVSAVDRFGMAQTFDKIGSSVVYGDLIFALGLPLPLKSLKAVEKLGRIIVPVMSKLPVKYLYPTGDNQNKVKKKHEYYYKTADVIAGDFHFIKKYMPQDMKGKIIITNTVTANDMEDLERKGVSKLITTTPELEGRSFGTNVMEGVLVSLIEKNMEEITAEDYLEIIKKLHMKPRIVDFTRGSKAQA